MPFVRKILSLRRLVCVVILAFSCVAVAPELAAQNVVVEVHALENGMQFLLVPRQGDPNVAVGWIAKVGSVNERPGITGTAHLFEHMMFKGTRVIGTKDIDKDLQIIRELDRVKAELVAGDERQQREAQRAENGGEEAAERSADRKKLLVEFQKLLAEQKEILVKDEFDRLYSAAGASGLNAGTTYDFTIYFVNVPTNKLELWFWMESDRLLNPVFREFYSERDVVREERRLRVESTPTGKFREQFESLFWSASPYGWPVIGWPSDVEGINRQEALEFYDLYYAPGNLTACLVGDFDPEVAKELADKYFGRLKKATKTPPSVRTKEVPQLAEKRMTAYAPTKPQVIVRYHTVPDGHPDEPALIVLADILSGRTGRLYKSLVLDKKVANSASAAQNGMKHEGYFRLEGVAKPDHRPEDVEAALTAVLEEVTTKPPSERELQKVKNQWAASEFRKLRSNFRLMMELVIRDAYRGWETINTDPPHLQAVTAEDVVRAVSTYFEPQNRTVLIYRTSDGADGNDTDGNDTDGRAEGGKP